MELYLSIPATSAPVESVFSYGGLFMRPHRACFVCVLSNGVVMGGGQAPRAAFFKARQIESCQKNYVV